MDTSITNTFFARTRHAKKIMMLNLGFLGDTVHLLPALWMLRQAYPQAELHVAVAAHVTSLFDCVPWVNRTWGYMRYPRHATLRENWQMVTSLRREKFDVLINLNTSDRSSWLAFFSGARERLGRRPKGGGPLFWNQMFTEHIEHIFGKEPLYWQHCHCLQKAGFNFAQPEFHIEIPAENLRVADISPSEAGTYFHISPFTTADWKELPPTQLAEFITALAKSFPEKKIALSCAPTEREKHKMTALLALLPQKPWRTYAGNLSLPQLAAVIKHSAVHFCGDTGPVHLATMTRTPTVAWFWPNPRLCVWVSTDKKCQIITGINEPGTRFLGGINTNDLIQATRAVVLATH